MKARRKGDTAPFEDVIDLVIGRGLDAKYVPINEVEFEQDIWQEPCKLNPEKDLSDPPEHWQAVREMAAIAAMQGVMKFFWSYDYDKETIAKMAVEQADALVKKLKGE